MKTLVGVDFFETTGHRLLSLAMLQDAVNEIARDPGSQEAQEQMDWLEGKTDSMIDAQACVEAVAGPTERGLARLVEMVRTDPQLAKRLLRQASTSFENTMERSSDSGDEARVNTYRSMAQSH